MSRFLEYISIVGATISFVAWAILVNKHRIFYLVCTCRRIAPHSTIERTILALCILGFVQYAATKETNGTDRSSSDADAIVIHTDAEPAQQGTRSLSAPQITNLCFTSILVSSNTAALELAWPSNFFTEGACLDFFTKIGSLTNKWEWIGYHDVASVDTNALVTVDLDSICESTNLPSAAFFLASDRATSASTMNDSDNDGIPDVYEFHNDTNPYVPDAELAPRLTVGDGGFSTIADALSASTNYSIVELPGGVYDLSASLVMPSHPVLLRGPDDGYAILRSTADIAAYMLTDGQTSETLLRNLYLVLGARGNFQAGFWIGGNLPWSGTGSSPRFENIRIRALYPDTLYYGWHYYCDNGGASYVSNCVMNAAGAQTAIGVYSYGGPDIVVSNCHFVNFSHTNGNYATYFRDGTNIVAEYAAEDPNLSWAGYPLDGEYSATSDSDGDGLSDFDEIFTYDTDPWLADSDGDEVSDGVEVSDGTDPRTLSSFKKHVDVVTDATDWLADVTNYVAWGVSADCWETNDLEAAWRLPCTNDFVIADSNNTVYVKSYRDANRNGVYDSNTDILISLAVPEKAYSRIAITFGDVDGDGIPDATELLHGTNPYDPNNLCFNMALCERGIFNTTNWLTAEVSLGAESLYGPVQITNRTWSVDFGHIAVTNGERVVAYFWDDANTNGTRDTGETCVSQTLLPSGHETVITNTLSTTLFDRDQDGILDWWEVIHTSDGLSPTNAADALLDPDNDGLINLHEYWAGCDPSMPDGSNTLLSVCSRSIDDRIRNVNPAVAVNCFTNYFVNGSNSIFIANQDCWAKDVDLSCVSVWNDDHPGSMKATAITRRHVVLAKHWFTYEYVFRTTNGAVVSRSISQSRPISDDLYLGRLNEPLPDSITLPKVLPASFAGYLSSGKYLPALCINQEAAATVLEVIDLDMSVSAVGNIHYSQYGGLAADNVVSSIRHDIRSVTFYGDSGSPVFLLLGNELVFLFSKHLGYKDDLTWRPSYGPMITPRLAQIQSQINAWEGGNASDYQINIVNLSQYDILSENGGTDD